MPRPDRIVLASQSPRRRRLLGLLGVTFESHAVDTPEELDTPLAADPRALAESLAAEKAEAALAEGFAEGALLLTFDTIVVHDGQVLGKPEDVDDAWRMLRSLSGATHQVVTGFAIVCPAEGELRLSSVVTNVRMKELTDEAIESWMALGEFMGCAGAYNIEGQVAEVTDTECHQNVAGLPLCHLYAELVRLPDDCRPEGLTAPTMACDAALDRKCLIAPLVIDGSSSMMDG